MYVENDFGRKLNVILTVFVEIKEMFYSVLDMLFKLDVIMFFKFFWK